MYRLIKIWSLLIKHTVPVKGIAEPTRAKNACSLRVVFVDTVCNVHVITCV